MNYLVTKFHNLKETYSKISSPYIQEEETIYHYEDTWTVEKRHKKIKNFQIERHWLLAYYYQYDIEDIGEVFEEKIFDESRNEVIQLNEPRKICSYDDSKTIDGYTLLIKPKMFITQHLGCCFPQDGSRSKILNYEIEPIMVVKN